MDIGDARELFTWHTICVDGGSQPLGRDTLSVSSRVPVPGRSQSRDQACSGTTLTVISAETPGTTCTSTLKSPSVLIG